MKDQDCNKLPQEVLEDSCFGTFMIKLDNFEEHIPEKKCLGNSYKKREKRFFFFNFYLFDY